jgi:hypothetical protein
MHPTMTSQLAAQRIAEWHRQPARQCLVRQVRVAGAAGPLKGRVQAGWVRLRFRRSRPVAA